MVKLFYLIFRATPFAQGQKLRSYRDERSETRVAPLA